MKIVYLKMIISLWCALTVIVTFANNSTSTQIIPVVTIHKENGDNVVIFALYTPTKQDRAGSATCTEYSTHLELTRIQIFKPALRKKGYGSQLLAAVLEHAKVVDKPVFATASPFAADLANKSSNQALDGLIRFYQKHGALLIYKDIPNACASIVFRQHTPQKRLL